MDSPATSSVLLNANGTFNKNLPNNQKRNPPPHTPKKPPAPAPAPPKSFRRAGPVNFSAPQPLLVGELARLCGFIQKNGLPVVYLLLNGGLREHDDDGDGSDD